MPRPLTDTLHDPAAEIGTLAALQGNPALAWQFAGHLRPAMFTEGRGEVYAILLAAAQAEQPMPALVEGDPAPDAAAAALRVRDLAAARILAGGLAQLGQQVGRLAEGGAALGDVLGVFEKATADARELHSAAAATLAPAGDYLGGIIAEVQRRAAHHAATGSSIMGIPTGYASLDDALNGLEPATLTVLAGQPGMGKTTFANLIAGNVAAQGVPVLYVSYENSRDNLILKHLCRMAGEPESDARRGKSDPHVIAEAAQRFAAHAQVLYYVEASADTTVETIRGLGLQVRRRHGAPRMLVVVDYLQKMAHTAGYDELRANVGAIAAQLRDLARTLDSPVLALASLNRGGYKDEDKEPTLSDLKESGDIEYGADVVLLMSEDKQGQGPPMGSGKPVRLRVAKNRGGPSGMAIPLIFKASIGDFREASTATPPAGANGHRR